MSYDSILALFWEAQKKQSAHFTCEGCRKLPSRESSPRHLKSLPFGSLLGCPSGPLGGQKGPQKAARDWGEVRQKVVPNRSPEGAPRPLPGPGWPGPARAGPAGPGAGQAGLPGLGLGLAGRPRQGPWGTLWGPILDDIWANWLLVIGSVWLRTASGYRQRLATDDVWFRAGYGGRLVTGGVRLQIAFGYGRRPSAGGVVLQPASGNRQRLVTGGAWGLHG